MPGTSARRRLICRQRETVTLSRNVSLGIKQSPMFTRLIRIDRGWTQAWKEDAEAKAFKDTELSSPVYIE